MMSSESRVGFSIVEIICAFPGVPPFMFGAWRTTLACRLSEAPDLDSHRPAIVRVKLPNFA